MKIEVKKKVDLSKKEPPKITHQNILKKPKTNK